MKRILNILIFASMIPMLHAADPSITQTTDTADSIAQKIKAKWNSLTPTQKRNIKIAAGIAAGATAAVGIGAASSRIHRAYAVNQAPQNQIAFCNAWNEQMGTLKTPEEREEVVRDISPQIFNRLNQLNWLYSDRSIDSLADEAQENMERELVKPTGLGINYWKDYRRRRQERNALQ